MTTPKTLAEVKNQENVIYANSEETIKDQAVEWFNLYFGDNHVYVRQIFTEGEVKVYEAYQDSGSVDYLYLIANYDGII